MIADGIRTLKKSIATEKRLKFDAESKLKLTRVFDIKLSLRLNKQRAVDSLIRQKHNIADTVRKTISRSSNY